MKKHLHIAFLWLFAFSFCLSGTLFAQQDDSSYFYFTKEELPDAGIYLPAPPAVESLPFSDDFLQWIWGKSMRETPRGKVASLDSQYGTEKMAEIYGEILGLTLNETNTPAIMKFMTHAGNTEHEAVVTCKEKYMRVRPFALMNEHVAGEFDDEEGLRHNGSYPSGHTALGWGTAMALAEMAPEYQDEILRRGYQYGESRVIVGAHWQSDVEAARLATSAAFARLHTSPEYYDDLAAARAEFVRLKKIKARTVGYPDGEKIMDPPIDTASPRYYGDYIQYVLAKAERSTARGQQALIDAGGSDVDFLNCFAPCLGITLSPAETPQIAALMAYARQLFLREASRMKSNSVFRKRPFAQLNEPSMIPEEEADNILSSSYPSSSSCMGWGLALVLVEVAPEAQNLLLTKAYEYGRSRVIVGYHFASDVQAGRILAACTFVRMQTDPQYRTLLGKAQEEYRSITQR